MHDVPVTGVRGVPGNHDVSRPTIRHLIVPGRSYTEKEKEGR